MATRTLEVRIIGDASSLSREFARAGTQAGFLERRLGVAGAAASRVGTQLGHLGRRAALVGTVGLGAAVKTAIDYEAAFAEVEKTVDATDRQFVRISDDIRGLSKEIPESAAELANLAGEAGALGVAARDVVDFTEVAAKLGTTTNLASDEAATALARISNIMDSGRGTIERYGSTLVDLGNKGASTEAEITEMALRIAGAAKTIGLSEASTLGLAAALANVGIRAEAGGSSISRVLLQMSDSIATGGEELEAFAEIAGVTTEEFAKRFREDAPGAIAIFAEGLGEVADEGGSVSEALKDVGLNEIRVRDTLLRLAGNTKQFSDAQRVANRAWRENTALSEEAEKRYDTLQAQVEILRNHAQDLAIELGEDMLPVLKEVTSILKDEDLPLGEKLGQISEILIEETAELIPEVAGLGGRLAVALGEGFVRAWEEANPLQKVLIGAAAIRFLGGRGALLASGRTIGMLIGTGVTQGVAGSAGAAAGVGGLGGTVIAPTTIPGRGGARTPLPRGLGPKTVPTPFGPIPNFGRRILPAGLTRGVGQAAGVAGRFGAVGTGVLLADQLLGELARQQAQGGEDPIEAIRAQLPGSLERVIRAPIVGGFGDTERERGIRDLADQLEAVQRGASLSADEAERLRDEIAAIGDLSEEAKDAVRTIVTAGRERGRFEEFSEDLRDSYERAFSLKDLAREHRSDLAEIRANFGRGTKETRELSRTAKRAMARHLQELVDDGRISMRQARRFLRRFGMSVDDLPDKLSGLEQSAKQHFAGVGEAAEGLEGSMRKVNFKTKPIFENVETDARQLFAGVGDASEKADRKTRNKTKNLADGVEKHVGRMVTSVDGGLSALTSDLDAVLGDMGLAPVNWSVTRARSGGRRQRRQTGGPILSVPGAGTGDIVDAALPPDWFVLNRNASRAMGFQAGGLVPVRLEPGETAWPPELAGLASTLNEAIPRFQRGGSVSGDIGGLVPQFLGALRSMAGAAGRSIFVQSGLRSRAQQEALYAAWLAGTGNLAARPGTSRHEQGIAADITPGREVFGGMAGRFGLGFTVPSEPWHIELLGAAAAGRFGPSARRIARRILQGPAGPLRDFGQGVLDRAARGMRRYAAERIPKVSIPAGSYDGRGNFVATSYGPPWGGINGTGVTATGVDLRNAPEMYGIAVDPSVIPLGSKVKVWPNPFRHRGRFTAFDTGGAIKGNRIDFYDWRGRAAQLRWGTRRVNVQGAQRGGLVGTHLRARRASGAPIAHRPIVHVTVLARTIVHDGAVDARRIETIADALVTGRRGSDRRWHRMGEAA